MSNDLVIAKLFRLGKDGSKFSADYKKLIRSRVIISERDINTFNSQTQTSGQMYEIDKEATAERNEILKVKADEAKATSKAINAAKLATGALMANAIDEVKKTSKKASHPDLK
jgi:hypothetical protein